MRMANNMLNETPNMLDKQRRTSQQIFGNTNVQPNPKHWKPIGCPVYVLDSRLQGSGGIFHKWKQRSKVGINLGRSPQHARSMALVLSRETALVGPQFHVAFDSSFHLLIIEHSQMALAVFSTQTYGWRRKRPPPSIPSMCLRGQCLVDCLVIFVYCLLFICLLFVSQRWWLCTDTCQTMHARV
jgi:hypothetical protein